MPFVEFANGRLQSQEGQSAPPSKLARSEVYTHIVGALERKRSYIKAKMSSREKTITFPLGRGKEYTVYEIEGENGKRALQIWRGEKGSSIASPTSIVCLDIYTSGQGSGFVSYDKGQGKATKRETVRGFHSLDDALATINDALPELSSRPRKDTRSAKPIESTEVSSH